MCQFYSRQPDLLVLDLMMPTIDGWQVWRRIRTASDVPIIILTAVAWDQDVVRGLDCGADDYVTKPFSVDVLLVRIPAVLRRTEFPSTDDGYLAVDSRGYRVLVRAGVIKVSPTAYRLLAYLLQNAGRVLTYEQILCHVSGEGCEDHPEYVHAYV